MDDPLAKSRAEDVTLNWICWDSLGFPVPREVTKWFTAGELTGVDQVVEALLLMVDLRVLGDREQGSLLG